MFDSFKVYPTKDIYIGKIRTIDPMTKTDVYVKTVAFRKIKEKNGILDSNKDVDTFIPFENIDIYYYCDELDPILEYISTSEVRPYITANRINSILLAINTGEKSKIKVLKEYEESA